MIVAVDGPAAAGKGTIARALAQRFGFHFLDTGTLYRMVGKAVLDGGGNPGDQAGAIATALAVDPARYSDAELRGEIVGAAASVVSAIPEVRAALLDFQRDFARRPPGAVLDGRDIGTVVCPKAEVKLFVTAAPEVRARRRARELAEQGAPAAYETVLADIHARDSRDRSRASAPMLPAPDARVLDTSAMDIGEAIEAAAAVVSAALKPAPVAP